MDTMFWSRVREELKRTGRTQESLAEAAGINRNTLQGWMVKGRLPDVEEATRIAHVLGLSVEFLVTGALHREHPWIAEHRELFWTLNQVAEPGLLALATVARGLALQYPKE